MTFPVIQFKSSQTVFSSQVKSIELTYPLYSDSSLNVTGPLSHSGRDCLNITGRKRNAPAAFQRPTALLTFIFICAERKEKAKRAAGRFFFRPTATLFSYYLRGCSRARSFRTWTVRNLILPDAFRGVGAQLFPILLAAPKVDRHRLFPRTSVRDSKNNVFLDSQSRGGFNLSCGPRRKRGRPRKR